MKFEITTSSSAGPCLSRLTDVLPPVVQTVFNTAIFEMLHEIIVTIKVKNTICNTSSKCASERTVRYTSCTFGHFIRLMRKPKRQKYKILLRQIGELEENSFLGWEELFCKNLKFIQLLGDTLAHNCAIFLFYLGGEI